MTSFDEQPLSEGQCFLCGCFLAPGTRADEHVIPKWLQNKHRLWNQTIYLRNNTTMPYRQATIPCCNACNAALNASEVQIVRAFGNGYDSVAALHPYRLFLWLVKVSYGLLFRELLLPFSRREPKAGPITNQRFLRRFKVQHVLLQGVFRRVVPYGFPASIHLYKTEVSDDPQSNFDFVDNFVGPFVGLRSNDVGILAILQDWGLNRHGWWPQFGRADHAQPLSAMQFKEIVASCLYQATLLKRPPRIRYRETANGIYVRPEVNVDSTWDLFAPFRDSAFAHALAHTTGWPVERLYAGDKIVTWFTDAGEPSYRPAKG